MNHWTVVLLGTVLLLGAACANQPAVPPAGDEDNPLLAEWNGPFGAPPFDRIREFHFAPAFEAAMQRHVEEVQAIVNNPEPPTFANTVEALERSGRLLDRVTAIFENLNQAASTEALQKLAREIHPKLSRHEDEILMNARLFQRLKVVWEQRESLDLTPEQAMLLKKQYEAFVRGGANLDDAGKAKLKELNAELSRLTTRFGENLLKEMNSVALLIEDEKDLVGLPDEVRAAAAELARASGHPGAWAFNLQRTSWTPFLQYSERRDLRKKLFDAYTHLCAHGGDTDNREIAARIAALRTERAQLLGYPTHADYVLEENMAKTPGAVYDLLDRLWKPALASAKKELGELQAIADRRKDGIRVRAWDWWFYAEKLRSEKYAFDESEVKPYLELERVRQAAFDTANKLWGITFHRRDDIPVYHPDVQVFEVRDGDGSTLGLFYTDYFAREGKRGGAWMDNFRQQWIEPDGTEVRPLIVNVGNFTKPQAGKPALLSLDEASTVFHEFGHAMHGMLTRCHYASLSGTNVDQDFVEMPSQMMENWAFAPEVMRTYAVHVQTGQSIPQGLIDKLQRAKKFNQGFMTTEYLAASILDMDWHTLKTAEPQDAEAFEAKVMHRIGIIPEIAPRYRTTYFGHIFSGGYSAGYYSYVWAEVLDADAFQAFKEKGLFDPDLARSYRKNILEKGGTEDPMTLYLRFRGRKPSIEPLLERRGLAAVS